MRVIPPLPITDAILTSSTCAEPSAGEAVYNAATTYAVGDVVIVAADHRTYQSLQAGNLANTPITSPTWWLDIGASNRWKMFDLLRNTQTEQASPLTVVLTPGLRVNSLALLGLVADSVTVSVVTGDQLLNIVAFGAVGLLVIAGIVMVNEATRQIPIVYARRVRGNKMYGGQSTYLPLRVNQAGVIPIIFAVSLVLIPSLVGQYLAQVPNVMVARIAQTISSSFQPTSIPYNVIYFFLVLGFTYFYTAIIFNPKKIAEEIQKYGDTIPIPRVPTPC